MEIKTLDDILKLRDEFSKSLEKRIKALERPGAGTAETLLEEKRALVKQSKASVAAAERSKAAMVKRLDDELGRHKQALERHERELDELTKAAKSGERPPRVRAKRAKS